MNGEIPGQCRNFGRWARGMAGMHYTPVPVELPEGHSDLYLSQGSSQMAPGSKGGGKVA